jgi:hypothetical protein
VTDDFLPMIRGICARLGIETPIVTDAFGRPTAAIDRAGMEKIRDTARATGFPELADGIDAMLAASPTLREQDGRIVPIEGDRP